ncbi:NAD-dependent dihydroorotate dehydrogenase B electron transfer subunit [Sediminibacillus dalangtanensis]|uniref:Dihydroorotate dehydrogenase B (NAD(+)), electron transfer subunit n=1 Tax=Sediminibacillus dalangtanensis TaxID=2729421 RepID=A0ABX7VXM7_9BACI|nr:dihydroorotate dehydrogenase electron transfer subunit [Sediminibacillus dalangtanensis]QTM99356.1 NAD-dependent dihydroorotate dehydrogenase B electron transfer subunit [Sediminibacillus dalangtanensis]
MMQTELIVLANEKIADQTIEMQLGLNSDNLGTEVQKFVPGQFLHVKVGEADTTMLRRPISIADVDGNGNITIIFKISGRGTDMLSKQTAGSRIDALLPCGTGYPVDNLNLDTALLIGGGIGVPPLYYLGKTLAARGTRIISILGFQKADHVFYKEKFAELGESIIVTDDGSYGEKGFVTDCLKEMDIDFDCFFSCGPTPMLQAVTNKLTGRHGYISVEQRMGCGIGACYACVVPAKSGTGFKKICKDGPVFAANEVSL